MRTMAAYFRERLGNPTDEVLGRLYLTAFTANGNQRLRADEMPLLRTDPIFAPLRSDPRFDAMIERFSRN